MFPSNLDSQNTGTLPHPRRSRCPQPLPPEAHIRLASGAEDIRDATALEYEVFRTSGYVQPNERGIVLEYTKYADVSRFVLLHHGPNLVGMSRIVHWGSPGFPTMNDMALTSDARELVMSDPMTVADVTSLCLIKEVRARGNYAFASALIRAVTQICMDSRMPNCILILDSRYHRSLRAIHKLQLEPIGPVTFYMGGDCIPCLLDIPRQLSFYRDSGLHELKDYFFPSSER